MYGKIHLIILVIMTCILVGVYQYFFTFTLKMQEICFSDALVSYLPYTLS
jgi:hypothetical protein